MRKILQHLFSQKQRRKTQHLLNVEWNTASSLLKVTTQHTTFRIEAVPMDGSYECIPNRDFWYAWGLERSAMQTLGFRVRLRKCIEESLITYHQMPCEKNTEEVSD